MTSAFFFRVFLLIGITRGTQKWPPRCFFPRTFFITKQSRALAKPMGTVFEMNSPSRVRTDRPPNDVPEWSKNCSISALVRSRSWTIPIYGRNSSARATLRAAGVALGRVQLKRTMTCMILIIDRDMKFFFWNRRFFRIPLVTWSPSNQHRSQNRLFFRFFL
jgi:hypothetical protein